MRHLGELRGYCGFAGLEFDVAIGGIFVSEEVEEGEEVGWSHVIGEGIGRCGWGDPICRDQREKSFRTYHDGRDTQMIYGKPLAGMTPEMHNIEM